MTKKSKCEYCDRLFEQSIKITPKGKKYRTKNKTCSLSCVKQLKLQKRKQNNSNYFWSEAETDFLVNSLLKLPLKMIEQNWNDIAVQNGWKKRPNYQIRNKANLLKNDPRLANNVFRGKGRVTRIRPTKDNWCLRDLFRILKLKKFERLRRWIYKKGLPFENINFNGSKGYYIIKRSDLKKFALKHPEEFWGIERKNLAKVLPSDLASSLAKLNRKEQPSNGRSLPIVRLDKEEYYPSATQAANALDISVSTICMSAKTDKVLTNGMDFFRFDYPTYWIPSEVVKEFNLCASQLIYIFYTQLQDVSGYRKQSCLIVAARCAVQTTLKAFRKRRYQKDIGEEIIPQQLLVETIKDSVIKNIKFFLNCNYQDFYNKLLRILTRKIYHRFLAIAGNQDKAIAYCEDFTSFYIENGYKAFSRTALPLGYVPKDKLQLADCWSYIYKSVLIRVPLKNKDLEEAERLVPFYWVQFSHFCRKYKLEVNENKTTSYLPDWQQHNPSLENTDDAKTQVQELLDKAKEKYSPQLYDRLSMLVALKLEDASDREIADCLGIKIAEISLLLNKLQQCNC